MTHAEPLNGFESVDPMSRRRGRLCQNENCECIRIAMTSTEVRSLSLGPRDQNETHSEQPQPEEGQQRDPHRVLKTHHNLVEINADAGQKKR